MSLELVPNHTTMSAFNSKVKKIIYLNIVENTNRQNCLIMVRYIGIVFMHAQEWDVLNLMNICSETYMLLIQNHVFVDMLRNLLHTIFSNVKVMRMTGTFYY